MNAAARSLARQDLLLSRWPNIAWDKSSVFVMVLIFALLMSAIAIVYAKNCERCFVSELESLRNQKEQLQQEWSQLLLEQATWAAPERVQAIATQQYGMNFPTKQVTVSIQ